MNELRVELENKTFEAWRDAEDKIALEQELRILLHQHAQAVMYQVLRRTDPALLVEAVDRVIYNAPSFEGNSLFTTWAHRILMNAMYDQRRIDRRRKMEISVEIPGFDLPAEPTNEMTDMMLTVNQVLKDTADKQLFECLVLMGMNYDETSKALNMSRTTVGRNWERVQRTLRHVFVK